MSVMFGKAKSGAECNLVLLGVMGCGKSGQILNLHGIKVESDYLSLEFIHFYLEL